MDLPGYDAWKTREPESYWEVCGQCGGNLQRDHHGDWYCERCDDEADYLAALEAMDEGEPVTLEDLDKIFGN